MHNLLVVEDDNTMAIALCEGFRQEGYQVALATDGEAALEIARRDNPALIVLDVMLPKLSGHDVCRQLRHDGSEVPIIMLTARSQDIDKVVGLKMGADDYLTKPFSFMELLARVEAVLRRSKGTMGPTGTHTVGALVVDLDGRQARRDGVPVELSDRELR
ncbi:MAG: response regulator transcription factor, partial [Myxococcota bacterium]